MNESSFSDPALWEFVTLHADDDADALRLKYSSLRADTFEYSFAADQIESRRKARVKLREVLARVPHFIFPSPLVTEQATSWPVARYHASLLAGAANVLDMTAGLCIDALAMADAGANVLALDINPLNVLAGRHNAQQAGLPGLEVICGDSAEFVRTTERRFDIVFADPARRTSVWGKRIHSLSESLPDIPALLPHLRGVADRLLLKCSPMIDISEAIRTIPGTAAIYAVSHGGECKEVLIEACLREGAPAEPRLLAVDIDGSGSPALLLSFAYGSESSAPAIASENDLREATWLHEPAPAVMKLGAPAFCHLAMKYPDCRKLHPNTHIFLSPGPLHGFPGRSLQINGIHTMRSPIVKELKGHRINTVCRNFGMTPEQLKKRLRVTDGGDAFLYAVRSCAGHHLILAH